jgi:hypothetical protein
VKGQDEGAISILDSMTQAGTPGTGYDPCAIALVLIGLNKTQGAVKRLEQSYREGSLWSLGFRSGPILETLRNESHFRLFLSEVSCTVQENSDHWNELAG